MKNEAKKRNARASRFDFCAGAIRINEEPDDEILSFAFWISETRFKNCGVNFTSPTALRREHIQRNNLDAAVGNIGL